ncbi:MAG: glycosyltransferase, partial [Microcella sp.]|nr:glycosyltransferase [Microcella sp.]
MTTVAAIIPTLGTDADRLRRTVDAVLASRTPADLDVIVVVNAARGSRALDLPDNVRVIEVGANLGWAGGLHVGRSVTTADLLWLVQDDMVPDSLCLGQLMSELESGPTALVSPVIVTDAQLDRAGVIVGGFAARHSLGARLDPAVFDPAVFDADDAAEHTDAARDGG